MIVWGGCDDLACFDTGGIYDPATNAWTTTTTIGAPTPRGRHTAVWTGSRMIVWGGSADGSGGVYDPATDTWTPTSTAGVPPGGPGYTAVWTGSSMIVWLHGRGGVYDPVADTWTAVSTVGAPEAYEGHTAVWTGSRMIVWGGVRGAGLVVKTGGVYDPATDTWKPTRTSGAPAARAEHGAVWTGSWMLVWGGYTREPYYTNTGGAYDPATDTWVPLGDLYGPTARAHHATVWAGSAMVVWGGRERPYDGSGDPQSGLTRSGGKYNENGYWWATNTRSAPTLREGHTGVAAGSRMIVWGGWDGLPGHTNTGGILYVTAPPPTNFYTVPPCRVLDTRQPSGPTLGAPLTCGTEESFAVAGTCGVPSDAASISLNLTATEATAGGNVRLYPFGEPAPLASTVNYVAGVTRASNAVAALGLDGRISVLCSPSGTTHVLLDVSGYFR